MKISPNYFVMNTAKLEIVLAVAGLMAVIIAYTAEWVVGGGDATFGAKQLLLVHGGIALLSIALLSRLIDRLCKLKRHHLVPAIERRIEWAIVIAVFIGLNLITLLFQKPISLNEGQGFAGLYYYDIAQDHLEGRPLVTDEPYASRIGLSLMVAELFKQDLMLGFLIANLFANILSTILFVLWLRLFVKTTFVRIAVLILFLIAWHSPARRVFYEPVNLDCWMFVFLLAGFIGISNFRTWPLRWTIPFMCVITFFGVLFRDAAIIPAVGLLFAQNPIPPVGHTAKLAYLRARLPTLGMALPLIFGAIALVVSQTVTFGTGDYSLLTTVMTFLVEKPWPMYLLGWFVAFGPAIALIAFDWKFTLHFLYNHQPLLVSMALIALVGYVGGSATYRLLYWSAPIVFLLIGLVIERHQRLFASSSLFVAVLVICQMYSLRVFWLIPDYPSDAPRLLPLFSVPGNNARLYDVLGMSTDYPILSLALLQYLLLAAATVVYLRRQDAELIASANVQEAL